MTRAGVGGGEALHHVESSGKGSSPAKMNPCPPPPAPSKVSVRQRSHDYSIFGVLFWGLLSII